MVEWYMQHRDQVNILISGMEDSHPQRMPLLYAKKFEPETFNHQRCIHRTLPCSMDQLRDLVEIVLWNEWSCHVVLRISNQTVVRPQCCSLNRSW